jgi:hypothetical protein
MTCGTFACSMIVAARAAVHGRALRRAKIRSQHGGLHCDEVQGFSDMSRLICRGAGATLVRAGCERRVRRHGTRGRHESLGGSPTLRVQDHRLVNGAGQDVQLRGVNRAVFESRCTYDNTGIADGPIDQTPVSEMLASGRSMPCNEDCWLGITGSRSTAMPPATARG